MALYSRRWNSSRMRSARIGEIRNESAILVENQQRNILLGCVLLKKNFWEELIVYFPTCLATIGDFYRAVA
jgi:hypothetical protein